MVYGGNRSGAALRGVVYIEACSHSQWENSPHCYFLLILNSLEVNTSLNENRLENKGQNLFKSNNINYCL